MVRKILRNICSCFLNFFLHYAIYPKCISHEEIFILPEAGRRPFLRLIRQARHTIYMAAYKLTDETIIRELKKAADRNVQIKICLELEHVYKHEGIPLEEQDMIDPRSSLQHKYIEIFKPAAAFSQNHCKMLIVDGTRALISTGNFVSSAFEKHFKERNFAVLVTNSKEVGSIEKVFLADISGKRIIPNNSHIIWGPDQTRTTFLRMIKGAQKSIFVYQQDIQDIEISQALAQASHRGIDVRLLMNPFPFGGKEDKNVPNQKLIAEAGAKISLCSETRRAIHAKVLIIDEKEMYVGSCNFYTPSIDQTRELGKIVRAPKLIKKVIKIFERDWQDGTAFTF